MLSVRENDDRGDAVEMAVCEVYGAEHVGRNPDFLADVVFRRPEGHPLDGRDGEVKSCLPWITDGESLRRGRYYLPRGKHDELVDADGVYIFTVVDPRSTLEDVEILASTIVPATESFTGWLTWSDCGSAHDDERAAQFRHSELFDLPDATLRAETVRLRAES